MYTADGWVSRLAMASDDPGIILLLILKSATDLQPPASDI